MSLRRILVTGTVVAMVSGSAAAVPITFEFGGTVTEIIDNTGVLAGDVIVGDAFWGTYTFESTLPDSEPDPALGHYSSPTSSMHVLVGTFDLLSGNSHLITVRNGITRDDLDLSSSNFDSSGLRVSGMVASFDDHSASVFSSDALPLFPPPISAFDQMGF